MTLDAQQISAHVDQVWQDSILPALREYVRIPNQSPAFDADWQRHGYMDRAVDLAAEWVRSRKLERAVLEVLRLEGRTPVLLVEIEGTQPGTVLLYGHLDKQPPFEGWRTEQGLGPWTPVEIDGRLYGRGAADDGYAVFASVAAIEALQAQGHAHPRLVVLIECSEESGSPDLGAYIEAYGARIGAPDLVVCLDSGCGDYERLWCTTSLRGLANGNLHVAVLSEGVHSGDASGVIPSSFRILRQLLERLEDSATGRIRLEALHIEVPEGRRAEASSAAAVLGETVYAKLPLLPGMQPVHSDPAELILNRTWRPALAVTAQAGLPPIGQGGNVLRPQTSVRLSLRLPPTLDAEAGAALVKQVLEADPPYGAHVRFEAERGDSGWDAPVPEPWLERAIEQASNTYFGKPPCSYGEGGSIPFMGLLGRRYPGAQFLVTGVLGPHSNAHGPNEFLHIATARALTCCVAHVIASVPATRGEA
jgi:acetylornithine deacetylase/succinyl-diaminopimelate desuccinylase-like protein